MIQRLNHRENITPARLNRLIEDIERDTQIHFGEGMLASRDGGGTTIARGALFPYHPDEDITAIIGRAAVGYNPGLGASDTASFGHLDMLDYYPAIEQDAAGETHIWSAATPLAATDEDISLMAGNDIIFWAENGACKFLQTLAPLATVAIDPDGDPRLDVLCGTDDVLAARFHRAGNTATKAVVLIHEDNAGSNQSCLELRQDAPNGYIDFVGLVRPAIDTTTTPSQGSLRIEVGGAIKRIAYWPNA